MMRLTRVLAAAVLTVTAAVAVGATSETASAAPSKSLHISPAHPMKNEGFLATGQLSTKVIRPIKLQYFLGSTWRTARTEMTEDGGIFHLYGLTSKNRTYRFYAPSVRINGKTYKTVFGTSRKVTLASQAISAVVAPYTVCDHPDYDDIAVFAHFSPVRPGRSVTLHSGDHDISGYQDAKGNVILNDFEPAASPGAHYVKMTVEAYNNVASKTVAVKYLSESCGF